MPRVVRVGGNRKYGPIWAKLKAEGRCVTTCPHKDTLTIVNAVKKEKSRDKNKPKGKVLDIEITDTGIIFKLITDTSINNL